MQKSDMQFLHIVKVEGDAMQKDSDASTPWFSSSLRTNILVASGLFLVAIVLVAYNFGFPLGSATDNKGGLISAAQNEEINPEGVCLNGLVAERVVGLVAEQISRRTVERPDPFNQLDEFRAVGQLADKQKGLLTNVDQFQHRIILSAIALVRYDSVSNTVWCTGSVALLRLGSDNQDTYYKSQPRIAYQIQRTIDGSDVIVTIGNRREIERTGFLWAQADGKQLTN